MFVRPITFWLALAAFLVHAVLGCCAHHLHASEVSLINSAGHSHPVASVDHADGKACCSHAPPHEHHNPADERPCENHEHPHQDCDEGNCFFAVSSKVKLPISTVLTTIEMVAPVKSSLSNLQTDTQATLDYPLGAGSAGRARQLLQSWLL